MVDLVITPASVIAASGTTIERGTAGATITAGKALCMIEATGLIGLADNNAAGADVRRCIGIALNGASVGQPVDYAKPVSLITMGATLLPGVSYYLSDTPGGICPVADLAAGEYPTLLGMATTTAILRLDIQTPGVAL